MSGVWQPAVQPADLVGLRIHGLRGTAVARWIATATNPQPISAHAGRTSVSSTLDRRGHLCEDSDDQPSQRPELLYLRHR